MDEKSYYVEVEKQLGWVEMPVAKAIEEGATKFRCKDCHGAVKLLGRHVAHGPAPHTVHRSRQDSEYCPSGFYFRQNPEREPRLSSNPVL
jgi:hypothetical protein